MSLDYDFEPLLNKLNSLEKRVATKYTKEVLLEGAKPILESQQDDVPKGKTKNLVNSLGVGKFRTKKSNTTLHIGIVHNKNRSVTYGYYQHYGTRRMVGTYWINTAWVKSRKEAKEQIKIKLREIIRG